MNPNEKKALEDMKAFIEFALESDMLFYRALGTLAHDVNGLLHDEAGSGFLPRTTGYSTRAK